MRLIGSMLGIVLRIAALLAVTFALALALLVVRLANGPLSVGILVPEIENVLSASDGSFRVRIDGTVLRLADDKESLEITARGVRLKDRAGAVLATVPRLSLDLSIEAMLRGMLAPTRIIVDQPELRVQRDEEGTFQLGIGGKGGTNRELTDQLVRDFLAPPDSGRAMGYLKEVAVHGATLTVDDRMLGASWRAPRAAATLFRSDRGMSGDLALAVEVEDKTAELHGEFRYAAADHHLATAFTIAGWELAKLQHIAPMLAPLSRVRAPISGSVELSLDTARGRVDGARADLTAGTGAIVDPALPGGSVAIAGGVLKASYDPDSSRVTLHELTLDLAGPVATVTGTVDNFDARTILRGIKTGSWGGDLTVAADAVVRNMPANSLDQFWPTELAHNARDWVTSNIRDGVVEAHLATQMRLDPDGLKVVAVDSFGGSMKMHGLTVDYHQPLPPVRDVDGSLTFDRTRMTIQTTSGALKGERITGGTIVITDLDRVDQYIDIQLDIAGPLRDALEVIDTKPLSYAHEVGLDPSRVDGTANAHLSFYFMLDHRTTFDQVQLGVQAQLAGVALRKIAFGQDLTEGKLQLRLDRGSLQLDGSGRLAGAPATIGWLQYFKPREGVRSQYTVRARVDDAARRALGLDLPANAIVGPVDVDATMKVLADKRAEAAVNLDLGGAALAVPDLDWSKSAGVAATAQLDLDLVGDRLAAIREATVKGHGVDMRLDASFAGDQGLQHLDVERLVLGDTDLTGTVSRRRAGGWRAELRGAALDATALIAQLDKPGPPRHDAPPLILDAKVDRVILGPKREARNVVLQLFSDGVHWQTIRLDAAPFGTGSLKLVFGEAGGKRPFSFAASDLGAMLRLFDVTDQVAGGQITAAGQAEDSGTMRTFVGHFDGGNYRVLGAPVFAKLLSLASLTSIASLLAGEGIPFAKLTGEFMATDGKIALRQARTYGGALGINASGTVNLGQSTLDLDGTLVPAYTLNSIIGNIPVIGNLLLGGAGQGIFAAGFHIEGSLDDPKTSVNPLTALAPGVLRNLFIGESTGPGNSSPPSAKPDSK